MLRFNPLRFKTRISMVFIKHCTQTSVPGRPVTGGVDDSLIKKTNLSHESIKNVEFAGN